MPTPPRYPLDFQHVTLSALVGVVLGTSPMFSIENFGQLETAAALMVLVPVFAFNSYITNVGIREVSWPLIVVSSLSFISFIVYLFWNYIMPNAVESQSSITMDISEKGDFILILILFIMWHAVNVIGSVLEKR